MEMNKEHYRGVILSINFTMVDFLKLKAAVTEKILILLET